MDKMFIISYREVAGIAALSDSDRRLMEDAIEAAQGAYAPYSRFHVGVALRLADGSVVVGNNQENAAYPSGLCAERTALFAASSQRPDMRDYDALAIVGVNEEGVLCEASPCGACRQVMSEYENLQKHPMKVICYIGEECVRVFNSVSDLLPFSFQF